MKIVVLDAASLGKDIDLTPFNKYGDVTIYGSTSKDQVVNHSKDADILILNRIELGKEEFSKLPKLKLVCLTATGYNNIKTDAAKEHGVAVANVVGYSTESVAQHTFGMLLYFMQHIRFYDDYIIDRKFVGNPVFSYMERSWNEINGKKWGIIGMGNIGRRVAKIASTFGANVSYTSVSGVKRLEEYPEKTLKELLSSSDIISIHAPINDKTRDLISTKEFLIVKNNLIILNLGRGGIINEKALANALDKNLVAGACLDVLVDEPLPLDNPLMNIQNREKLLITPHIAWASIESRQRLIQDMCLNIEAFISGKPRNLV